MSGIDDFLAQSLLSGYNMELATNPWTEAAKLMMGVQVPQPDENIPGWQVGLLNALKGIGAGFMQDYGQQEVTDLFRPQYAELARSIADQQGQEELLSTINQPDWKPALSQNALLLALSKDAQERTRENAERLARFQAAAQQGYAQYPEKAIAALEAAGVPEFSLAAALGGGAPAPTTQATVAPTVAETRPQIGGSIGIAGLKPSIEGGIVGVETPSATAAVNPPTPTATVATPAATKTGLELSGLQGPYVKALLSDPEYLSVPIRIRDKLLIKAQTEDNKMRQVQTSNVFATTIVPAQDKMMIANAPGMIASLDTASLALDAFADKSSGIEYQLEKRFSTTEAGAIQAKLTLLARRLTRTIEGARPTDYDAETYNKIINGDWTVSPAKVANLVRQVRDGTQENVISALQGYTTMQQGPEAVMSQLQQAKSRQIPAGYVYTGKTTKDGLPVYQELTTGKLRAWRQ